MAFLLSHIIKLSHIIELLVFTRLQGVKLNLNLIWPFCTFTKPTTSYFQKFGVWMSSADFGIRLTIEFRFRLPTRWPSDICSVGPSSLRSAVCTCLSSGLLASPPPKTKVMKTWMNNAAASVEATRSNRVVHLIANSVWSYRKLIASFMCHCMHDVHILTNLHKFLGMNNVCFALGSSQSP